MGAIETMKTISTLAKKGMSIELQEEIIKLREEVIELKEENLQLKYDNIELKKQIGEMSQGELCPKCKRGVFELVDSKPHPTFGIHGCQERTYKCSLCDFSEKHLYDPNKA